MSLLVLKERCGGGRKPQNKEVTKKKKKTSQEERGGGELKITKVPLERSGGHQFCFCFFLLIYENIGKNTV